MKKLIERVPPQNIEAEQAVLGAMLIDKEAIIQVSEILTNIDFMCHFIIMPTETTILVLDHEKSSI